MNGYYYATKGAAQTFDNTMLLLIFLGIVFGVIALWAMVSIISMSRSLKDIRNMLQMHFTINDSPKPKIVYKNPETEAKVVEEAKTEE